MGERLQLDQIFPKQGRLFLLFCVVFGDEATPAFKASGFRDWKNAMGTKRSALLTHEKSEVHRNAALKALSFRNVVEGKKPISVPASPSSMKIEYRIIVLSIIDVVIALGQWNIPFRGHSWSKELKKEDGNFEYFLRWTHSSILF